MKRIRTNWIGFGEFIPLPGSKLFSDLLSQGRVSTEQVEKLQSFNFTNVDDTAFDRYIKGVRSTIVLPTRMKSYLIDNIKRPGAYSFLLKSMIGSAVDRYKAACHLS